MQYARHTINELLVGLFNYILYIEEKNLKKQGVKLSMTEVHLLESFAKASDNTMSYLAKRNMITQGTLTTAVKNLEKKGYVERYKDDKDGRIVRLKNTKKADAVLLIHDEFHRVMIDRAVADLGLEENKLLVDSLANILDYFREEYSAEIDN